MPVCVLWAWIWVDGEVRRILEELEKIDFQKQKKLKGSSFSKDLEQKET